ncbi:MAG: hypothetical protein DLM61_26230 [Pseudonocardiales bacterium]|nr:MAG: hypothetical protein DLM61_26230 [Pseudonocardiales bacterium]
MAKWTGRYDPHDPVWAEGRSRAPGRVANRTDAGIEARVLEVRTRLEENPWAQIGAPAVGWELEKLGAVVPAERTLERILERDGSTHRERPARRASKGIPYPAPAADRTGDVVQVDLVGPRHLHGGVRFHALNQIDVASRHAGIEIACGRATVQRWLDFRRLRRDAVSRRPSGHELAALLDSIATACENGHTALARLRGAQAVLFLTGLAAPRAPARLFHRGR